MSQLGIPKFEFPQSVHYGNEIIEAGRLSIAGAIDVAIEYRSSNGYVIAPVLLLRRDGRPDDGYSRTRPLGMSRQFYRIAAGNRLVQDELTEVYTSFADKTVFVRDDDADLSIAAYVSPECLPFDIEGATEAALSLHTVLAIYEASMALRT